MTDFHENYENKKRTPQSSNFSFGMTFFILTATLSLYPLIKGEWPTFYFSSTSSLILLFVTFKKSDWLQPFNLLWTRLALLINQLTQPIIMFLLFFAFITPLSFFFRRFARKDFQIKWNKKAKTYWVLKKTYSSIDESMKNQF